MKLKFISEKEVEILNDDGVKVGQIFTPSSSANNNQNCIQVCGFSEAFDFWGCGIFKGFKDIQLLFDEKAMKGHFDSDGCCRCFIFPCNCEVKHNSIYTNPFMVKREEELKERIHKNGKVYKLDDIDYNKLIG